MCRLDGSWDTTPPLCIKALWEQYEQQLATCLATLSRVTGCDDIISEMKKEVEDDVWALSLLLKGAQETQYSGTRHSFVLSKLLLRVRDILCSDKINSVNLF